MINEDNWENSTNRNMRFFMNDQDIMFGYPPPMEKSKKSKKCQSINFDECLIFLIDPFLLRGYNLFSQNTDSSIEQ